MMYDALSFLRFSGFGAVLMYASMPITIYPIIASATYGIQRCNATSSRAAYGNSLASQSYSVRSVGVRANSGGKKDSCLFKNQLPDKLADELALAKKLGVKPVSPSNTKLFDDVINNDGGGKVKFVITEKNELLVMPAYKNGKELSHSVLNNGNPVKAAGEVEIAGKNGNYIGLTMSNHSGHYNFGNTDAQNSVQKALSEKAFARYGINFN